MNAVIHGENKWNPFKEMEDLHNRLAGLFGSGLGRASLRSDAGRDVSMPLTEWAPPVDITEDDKEYLITAELPEIRKEDLSVTVENGVLTISGDRKFEKEEKGKRYHRVERSYGSFARSFTLPDDANAAKVNAEFREGLLKIHVAKSEEAKPKTIDVKVA